MTISNSTDSSSSQNFTIEKNPTFLNPQFQNINNFIPIKLKKDNYNLWRSLFLPVLTSFDMLKFIDGSAESPQKLLQSIDPEKGDTFTINPDYLTWLKADQTLLIWMNATISEDLLPYTIGCSSARSLWEMLQNRLGSLSRTHILQLKSHLQQIRKGNSSIAAYLQQIKEITDALAASGNIVDDIDLVFHILNGLPNDYDSFATSIRLKDPPITSDVLHSLLLSEEICVDNRLRSIGSVDGIPSQAFYASQPTTPSHNYRFQNRSNTTRGRGKSPIHNNNTPSYFQPSPTSHQEQNPLNPYNKCFSQYFSTSRTKPVCQICHKPNHSAVDCYHRMDFAYAGKQPPHKLKAMAANSHPNKTNCSSPNWILDSGANSHLTNDLSQLNFHTPYQGHDQIQTASGDYMPISNIGQHFGDDAFPRTS